jgi:hypothetical protein
MTTKNMPQELATLINNYARPHYTKQFKTSSKYENATKTMKNHNVLWTVQFTKKTRTHAEVTIEILNAKYVMLLKLDKKFQIFIGKSDESKNYKYFEYLMIEFTKEDIEYYRKNNVFVSVNIMMLLKTPLHTLCAT